MTEKWEPTNADDVRLTVSKAGTGDEDSDIADTNSVVVDDFSIETDEDLEGLSGLSNAEPQGVSRGDIEHSFSFTIQGEDANVFNDIISGGRAIELEIIAKMDHYKDTLTGAYAGTRSLSATSGDPIEYEVEGIATGRNQGTTGGDSSESSSN